MAKVSGTAYRRFLMCWADPEKLLANAPVAHIHSGQQTNAKVQQQMSLRPFRSSLCKIWFVSLLSFVLAQNQTSHPLTLTLPRLLSMKLNDTQLVQPLFLIADNLRETTTATQLLGIRTNGVWLLSASFTPCHPNDAARLSLRPDQTKEGQPLRTYPRVVLTGAATNGWRFIPLDSYLEPSVSPCQGNLIYTLTQP